MVLLGSRASKIHLLMLSNPMWTTVMSGVQYFNEGIKCCSSTLVSCKYFFLMLKFLIQ